MADSYAVFEVEDVLLVTIGEGITDTDIIDLQEALSERIVHVRAQGVVIDISGLEIIDTFVGRSLGQLARIAKILDASPFVVGMRPAVAMTLVELGMDMKDMSTALSVNHAIKRLRRRV